MNYAHQNWISLRLIVSALFRHCFISKRLAVFIKTCMQWLIFMHNLYDRRRCQTIPIFFVESFVLHKLWRFAFNSLDYWKFSVKTLQSCSIPNQLRKCYTAANQNIYSIHQLKRWARFSRLGSIDESQQSPNERTNDRTNEAATV